VEEEDTIRRMEFVPSSDSLKFLRKEERRTNSGRPLALLVQRGGGCSIEDKARNIMRLNDMYSTAAGPKVEFMILVNDGLDGNISRNDDVVQKGLTIDIGVVYVDVYVGDDIWLRITGRDDKYQRSFLSEKAFGPNTDDWSFEISIDGVYLTPGNRRWITMLYIFIGIILAFSTMRFMSLLIMNRGCRWSRDDTGRFDGVIWNRESHRVMTRQQQEWYRELMMARGSIIMSALRGADISLRKLSEEQINDLPVVKYNVTNIEAVSRAYFGETVGDTSSTGDVLDVGTKDRASFQFLQNAYQSCTSCSICIDDYEQGENLILLPECGHFFHPQCITPWLKDKKGSCPLCQTMVLPQNITQPSGNCSESDDGTSENTVDGSMAGLSSATGDGMNSSTQSISGSISARVRSYVHIPSLDYATHSIEEESDEGNNENNSSNEEAVSLSNGGNGENDDTADKEVMPLSNTGKSDKNDNFNEEEVALCNEGNGDINEVVDVEVLPLSNSGNNETLDEEVMPLSNGGNGDHNEALSGITK